ncbi:MAG: hypothetical protein GX608_09665, partial [Lentisphaerae bacterium]|nr:hypothetical protein [Lentisphaerota bacterium]
MRRHILSIGIVLCLALALQAPARAAVQMRLPSLKKYYLDTVLVSNGAAASAIVAPDAPGYADLAGDVRRAIKDLTGAELPVITDAAADAELAQAGGGRRAMIVLGNISVNKVSERLYVMEQVDVDAGWPGAGGYLLQTVHDPMGDGRNFISLGGSDLKGAQGAAQAFIDSLKPDGRSLKVGRLFKLEGTYKGPAPLTVAHVNRKGYGSPNAAVSHAGECAHILRRYRTPGYGRMFRHAMERIAAAIKNGEEWEDRDANCGELPLLWDIIEECEEFDAKDEADVILQGEELADNGNSMFDDPGKNTLDDRTFISDIMYAHAQIQDLVKGARDQGAGKNSGAGISGLYAGLYFNKYYPGLEIGGKLLKNADFFFSSPIKHWRVIDNATGYGDMVWYANLQYSLLRPNMAYFSSGIARKAADYHIIITSNLGRSGGFGDSLSWTKGHFSYHPVLYPMCAWYYRDGSYLWWFRKCGGRAGTYLGHYSSSMLAGRYIVSGLEEKPPVRWLGVKPYPLDHWMYRAWKAQEPEEEHAHRYFDKMSFRAGFEATNQYLQLSGFSGSAHGHPDANGIINFSDNGCDFLDDTGYMIPDINEHTTLIVFRNGMGSDGPGLVQIDNIADFDDVAFTETTASGHNRTKWSRNIIWEKERYFAVFDEVEAEEDGEVGIVCVWRVNGGISLKGRELTATHGKQAMRLINMGGPRLRTSDVRLFQTQDAAMKKGEKTVIANLFYAAGPSDDLSIDIERLASNAMLVKQNGEFKVIGVGPCSAIAGLETDAALFHAGARAVHVSGCAKLSMPGFSLRSDKPVSAYLDLEKGTGVVEAAEVARVVLGSGAETVLDAGKGRTAIRFAPVPAERLAERVAPLPGLFAATAAARREEDARAEAARKAETELLKSRISVIWEARDLKAAGGPAGGSETRDLAKLLDGGDLSDVSQIMKASKQDGLEMVDGARSEMEGMKGVQWLETADRDGDGKSETLVGTASGYVTSLSHEGKPMWSAATVSIPALRGISGELRAVIGPPN